MNTYADYFASGERRASSGGRQITVLNPATERPSGEVHLCSHADLELSLRGALRCAEEWATSTVRQRQAVLVRLAAALNERREHIVQAMAEDIGCPVWLSRGLHVPMALKDLENAIECVGQVSWQEVVGNAIVERVPVGVVAAITPWNSPLHQICAKVGAAIAAGCSTVLKPSEMAPGCASLFIDALHAAELPPGLVNVVWGDAQLGGALLTDARVGQISFTGSTATGKAILSSAANRVTRVALELGGKSAAVLLDDADIDIALPAVLRSCMAHSGQTCVAQSRLIVPRHLVASVESRLLELIQAWPMGDPLDEATRLGPVASAVQFAHVRSSIAGAVDVGARVLCGGLDSERRTGYYIAPTIFADVRPEMEIAQVEVFGPVLSIMVADDETDAMRQANASPYGLSGAVWSRDVERAARVARRMRTGQVVLNGAEQNLATPFGGWGQSGLGRENGRFGIEEFLQYRVLQGLADEQAAMVPLANQPTH